MKSKLSRRPSATSFPTVDCLLFTVYFFLQGLQQPIDLGVGPHRDPEAVGMARVPHQAHQDLPVLERLVNLLRWWTSGAPDKVRLAFGDVVSQRADRVGEPPARGQDPAAGLPQVVDVAERRGSSG